MAELSRDLTRTVLAVLFLGGLIVASIWILRPFLAAMIWAAMIVVSTWPLMLAVQGRLWGKRSLAVTAMTLALLLIFVAPFSAAIGTIVANADDIADWAKGIRVVAIPAPPDWVAGIPVVGESAAGLWRDWAAKGAEELYQTISPYAVRVVRWFAAVILTWALVQSVIDLSDPANSESGDSWFGFGPPLVIAVVLMGLGVVLMILQRLREPEFFRRRPETVDPDVAANGAAALPVSAG